MMRKKGIPSKRAIDYLVAVSKTTVEDYVGHSRSFLNSDFAAFRVEKDKVFAAIEGLKGTIASLVVLDQTNVERAAATSVVWHIMSRNLARPFVVSLVLVDFVLHITLLLVRTEIHECTKVTILAYQFCSLFVRPFEMMCRSIAKIQE